MDTVIQIIKIALVYTVTKWFFSNVLLTITSTIPKLIRESKRGNLNCPFPNFSIGITVIFNLVGLLIAQHLAHKYLELDYLVLITILLVTGIETMYKRAQKPGRLEYHFIDTYSHHLHIGGNQIADLHEAMKSNWNSVFNRVETEFSRHKLYDMCEKHLLGDTSKYYQLFFRHGQSEAVYRFFEQFIAETFCYDDSDNPDVINKRRPFFHIDERNMAQLQENLRVMKTNTEKSSGIST